MACADVPATEQHKNRSLLCRFLQTCVAECIVMDAVGAETPPPAEEEEDDDDEPENAEAGEKPLDGGVEGVFHSNEFCLH